MHVERVGTGAQTIVFIHGSMAPGWETWSAQRELASDFTLVVPHRSGYPPNPPRQSTDFDEDAAEIARLIDPGTHLVGQSYGAVVALLAAARAVDHVASLTVIEPPAFALVRGNPAAEELIAGMTELLANRDQDVRDFLVQFLDAVGSPEPVPEPLPPELEACARATMAERPPWEARIPFATLRNAGLPVLVVSGGHSDAFDAVCDVIEHELGAERAVIRGAAHEVQSLGAPFNRRLREFIGASPASDTPASAT